MSKSFKIGQGQDLHERKRMMHDIGHRDDLLNVINRVAVLLLQSEPDTFKHDLIQCMGMMAGAMFVDRVYIWKNHRADGKLYCTQLYEWSGGAEPQQDSELTINVSYDDIAPSWEETLSQGNFISGFVREMAPEIKALLSAQDILSIFIMPLFVHDQFWGFVGFDDCHRERIFTENEKSILQSGCILMANALLRNAQVVEIREAHDRAKIMLDKTPFACHLWNRNIEIVDCNDENIRLFQAPDKKYLMDHYLEFIPEHQPDGQSSVQVMRALIQKAFNEEKSFCEEFIHLATDGSLIPTENILVRVPFDDDYVVAVYIRDLREYRQMMNVIGRKTQLLNTVNQVATILLKPESDEFQDDIQLCMSMIGQAVGADRVCIWKNSVIEGKLHCTQVNEWVNDVRLRTERSISTNVPYEGNIPTWGELLPQGKCVNRMTRDLSPVEQARMAMHGIKSNFSAPVFVHDKFWGFVGCDNCRNENIFTEDEASILYSGTLLIANSLIRNEMLANIRDSSIKLETALNDATRANEAKSSFLANMSHEMRTPLNAVIGLTDLTLGREKLDKEVLLNLEKINNAGMTLLSTVNDILDISKIEAGKFELIPVVYDLPSLINDTIIQSLTYKEDKPIEFILDIDQALPVQLNGDELRIKQIFNNLLSNAFKYTEAGMVELGLSCRREGDIVWMSARIRDTGVGIRAEDMERIFDDYAQMSTRNTRRIMGTGLGLSITKSMIELMNGTISVESEFGKGSVFSLKYPQQAVSEAVIGPEMADTLKSFRYYELRRRHNSALTRISLPYARVLIVDDVITNLDVAKGLMKPYDMQIDCVTSGRQAVDAVHDEKVRYNAIFMDHMMPDMDGIEAARYIREIDTDYARTVPLIALTANAIVGNEEMFLDNGFQAFISKPIELSALDAVIRQWVRDKEQEQVLEAAAGSAMEGQSDQDESQDMLERRMLSNRRSGIDRRKIKMKFIGVDIDKGIERFDGDSDAYFQVLRSFAVHTRPLLDSMKNVAEDKLADYAVTVHGIKGSSGGIFAGMISEAAENLEKAALAKDFAYVATHNDTFLNAAWKLIFDLEDLLARHNAGVSRPVRDKPDDGVLRKLRDACKSYDMDGVDEAIAEIIRFDYEADGGLSSWLVENVEQMNFGSIVEKLSETLN